MSKHVQMMRCLDKAEVLSRQLEELRRDRVCRFPCRPRSGVMLIRSMPGLMYMLNIRLVVSFRGVPYGLSLSSRKRSRSSCVNTRRNMLSPIPRVLGQCSSSESRHSLKDHSRRRVEENTSAKTGFVFENFVSSRTEIRRKVTG